MKDTDKVTLTLGQLKRLVKESMVYETEGGNEEDVANFLFETLKRSYPSKRVALIKSNETVIDNDGNTISLNKDFNKTGMNDYGREGWGDGTIPTYKDDAGFSDNSPMGSKNSLARRVHSIVMGNHFDYAVVMLGKFHLPGDIVIVSTHPYICSVVEVKNDSLGSRVFNPTFKAIKTKNGARVIPNPGTRYEDMWPSEVIDDLNEEIKHNPEALAKVEALATRGNSGIESPTGPILRNFPLNLDFDDFVSNYSRKNPFGTIEYVALGYGDNMTFYKVVPNPKMDLYGTGAANRRNERRADSIQDEFNAAYLTLRARSDKKIIVGEVNFCYNGAIMTVDRDVKISFED